MELMEKLRAKAAAAAKKIVLPEGSDARIVEAAVAIQKEGVASIVLLGEVNGIQDMAKQNGWDLSGIELIDPATSDKRQALADAFFELRKKKGITPEQAFETVADPMYFGTMMLKTDMVDGLVGGALCTTADTLRPGLQIVKTSPGVSTVSSSFIMVVPDKKYGQDGVLIFADCAINIDPTPEELAAIAIASAATGKSVAGLDPKVAMLSFSTKGSGKGDWVDKVVKATQIVKEQAPDLEVDGELQADAALVASVGQLKSPGSTVAGHANVLVFPDIQAGNIGYKLVQRLAGAQAIGPICQGFAKPINDLSRGCSVEDIVNVVALTCLQA